jgi:hypothetical protein
MMRKDASLSFQEDSERTASIAEVQQRYGEEQA